MLTYVNEKYIDKKTALMNVRRYGRKSGYYLNIEANTKMEFGNNVSLNLIFFEFLHNEYKRSFVEMKFPKICDALYSDPYIGGAFKLIGVICPIPPGFQKLNNITVPMANFPNVWPFEKCKVEATLLQNKNRDIMATADIYATFKQVAKGK
ncbi:uncharacterized protein LOC125228703 [Leguminivora glycinivorella]|uniref:uncharacterized protein LOC125228703 n=1 Tax=Leguminivora glycinivorella TaxID=1035111 RepID=UPI00200F51D9|nr:uncharacterized protein LOC125228703 [Leguminivora glycinivorella]